ncbi:hypothetical protein RUM44_000887 [Polyplax serrata]|uniref:Uncharacterized protein n=1 Tax=Polyplax serrata TaxID=468196 RepID=A0ABR1B6B7_POLSC
MEDVEFKDINPNIKKRIIKKGKRGRRPTLKWICSIDLILNNQYGEGNYKSGSLELVIGDGTREYDRLLEQCLETMHLEEESSFRLKLTNEKEISIDIALRSVVEKPYLFQWTDEEKIKESNHYRETGAQLFKDNQIEEAFYKFSSALKLLLTTDKFLEDEIGTHPELDNLRVVLYNNLARCHLHYKNYSNVVELCDNSIKINSSVKALYRRAVAYIELKEYECAENDLVQLLKLEPRNKAVIEKYREVRELDRNNRENYHSILKKMFQ